jgi:hypothetical protein
VEDRIAGAEATLEDLPRLLASTRPTQTRCDLCGSTLYALPDARILRYRCAKGHAFTQVGLGSVDQPVPIANLSGG